MNQEPKWEGELNKEFFSGIPMELMGSNQVDEEKLQNWIRTRFIPKEDLKKWCDAKDPEFLEFPEEHGFFDCIDAIRQHFNLNKE